MVELISQTLQGSAAFALFVGLIFVYWVLTYTK